MIKFADNGKEIDTSHPLHNIPKWTNEKAKDNYLGKIAAIVHNRVVEVVEND